MPVYCQQLIDGEAIDPENSIEPLSAGMDDATLLRIKAESADRNGWDIEWLDDASFVARKVRWLQESLCERVFRIGSG